MSRLSRMPALAEEAVAHAAILGYVLDYTRESVATIAKLIHTWEMDARIACDLADDARVSEIVAMTFPYVALGAYFGEVFVRLVGAAWGEAEFEGGDLQPVVVRNGVAAFPIRWVDMRVHDGPHVDLVYNFESTAAEMTASP